MGCSCRRCAQADPRLLGAALVAAVQTARAAGSDTARQLAEQALEFARRLGGERLLIESLAASCEAYFYAGQPETARPRGQEAVELAGCLLGHLGGRPGLA